MAPNGPHPAVKDPLRTDRMTGRQTGKMAGIQTGKMAGRQTGKMAGRHKGRQDRKLATVKQVGGTGTERLTERQTDYNRRIKKDDKQLTRKTDRQGGRQTYRYR